MIEVRRVIQMLELEENSRKIQAIKQKLKELGESL